MPIYPYKLYKDSNEGHEYWAAESELPWLVAQGDTPEECVKELDGNEKAWLESAIKHNITFDLKPLADYYEGLRHCS